MPNGRCKFHGGKSTGPRTPEGLERSRRANWKHEGPGGATAGHDRKMNNEPLEREPLDRVRARSEALLKANAAPRHVTVKHIHQQVNVTEGGQAVVAGDKVTSKGTAEERRRGDGQN